MIQNKSNSGNDILWEDKCLPRSTRFDDTYYSHADGRAETAHVFINGNALAERWPGVPEFTITELGFGTGLNFLETVRQWQTCKPPGATLNFISFEQFPITGEQMAKAHSRWPELAPYSKRLTGLWNPGHEFLEADFDTGIRLVVFMGDANIRLPQLELQSDAWYLDGFAPSKNPELWNTALLQAVFDKTRPGGSFATYTAAGFVRRNLEAAGFEVERLEGFATKREMLAGIKA